MSWNPRRFAALVEPTRKMAESDGDGSPVLLWLTADAIERIESALKHGTLKFTDETMPPCGVLIGLAEPVKTSRGDAFSFSILPRPMFRRRLLADDYPPELVSEAASSFHIFTAHSLSGVGIKHALMSAVHRRVFPETREAAKAVAGDAAQAIDRIFIGDEDGQQVADFLRATWTIFVEPVEREVTATVTASETVRPRKGKRHKPCDVSVIDVRQPSGIRHTPNGRAVEHDHRWTVRGHWRMQPYGKGRAQRRRVWIDPQVRGPVDKPILARPKVYLVS